MPCVQIYWKGSFIGEHSRWFGSKSNKDAWDQLLMFWNQSKSSKFLMLLIFYYFRQNGKEFLTRALSDECRKYRHQAVSVNIKITFLSWAVECLEGIGVILVWAFAEEKAFRISGLFLQFNALLITPCTYIWNRETTKQIIVLENWLNGLKANESRRRRIENTTTWKRKM